MSPRRLLKAAVLALLPYAFIAAVVAAAAGLHTAYEKHI